MSDLKLFHPVSIYELPSLSDIQSVLPLWKADWNRIALDRLQRKQQQIQQHQSSNTSALLQQAHQALSTLVPSTHVSSAAPSSSSSMQLTTHQHVLPSHTIAPSPPRNAYSSRSSSASSSPNRSPHKPVHLSPSKYKHLSPGARAALVASSSTSTYLSQTSSNTTTITTTTAANIDLSQPIKLDFTPPYTLPVTSVSPKRPSKHGERMRAAAMAASAAPKVSPSPSKAPVLLTSPSSAEGSPSPTALNIPTSTPNSLKRKADAATTISDEDHLNHDDKAELVAQQSSSKKPKLADIISNVALQSARSLATTASFLHSSIAHASFHRDLPMAETAAAAVSSSPGSRKSSPSRVKAGRDLFASAPRRKSYKVVGKDTPGLHNGGGIASFTVGDDSVEERQRKEWMVREYESWIAKKKERERNEGITAEKMRTERLKRADEEEDEDEEAAAADTTMHDATAEEGTNSGASAAHTTPPPPSHTAIPQTAPSQLLIHSSLRSSGSSPSYSAQVSSAKRVKRSLFDQLNQSAASSAAPSPLRLKSPSQMPMPSPGLIAAAAAALSSASSGEPHAGGSNSSVLMQTPQKGQFTRLFQAASPLAAALPPNAAVTNEPLLPAPAAAANFKSPSATTTAAAVPPASAPAGLMASFSQKKNHATSGVPATGKPSGKKEQLGLTPKSLFFSSSSTSQKITPAVTSTTTAASAPTKDLKRVKGGLKAWLTSSAAPALPTTTPTPVSSGSGATRRVTSEEEEGDESDSGSEAADQLVIV